MNGIKRLALDDWKAKFAKVGTAEERVVTFKAYAGVVQRELDSLEVAPSRRSTFVITTGGVDRERDTLSAEGWKLDNYAKNPVVLFAHDYRALPIGKSVAIERTAGGLRSVAEFTTEDENPLGDRVLRLIRGGYLNTTSVGFDPLKWAYNETRGGVDFSEQELLEYSVVPVPANPEALVEARAKGVLPDAEPIVAWAMRALDEWSPEKGLFVSRKQIEHALVLLATPRSYSLPKQRVSLATLIKGDLVVKVANPFGGETALTLAKLCRADVNCQYATDCPATPEMAIEDCPGIDGACPLRGENQMDKPGGTEPTVPTPTPEENAGKGAVPFFTILEPDEPTDAQKLAEVVREVLTETVAAEGRAALTRLTGRID